MQKRQLESIVQEDPQLIWYTNKQSMVSDRSIMEHIINYGNWKQVKKMISILGIKRSAKMFDNLQKKPRNNLRPRAKHYFNLYFQNALRKISLE